MEDSMTKQNVLLNYASARKLIKQSDLIIKKAHSLELV